MALIWQLRVWVDMVKSSVSSSLEYVQKEFKKAGSNIEKAFWDAGSAGMKKLKKEAEITTVTIAKLNDKLWTLKATLNTEEIWWKKFKQLQKEIAQTEKELQKASGATSNFWTMIKWAFSIYAIAEFWKAVFGLTSKNQQLYNSFMTLTWSAEMTKNILAQIQSLADQSPFEKFALADQIKKMIWYWFEAQNAVNIMQVLGNTVSALGWGQEVLDWLTLALWQIQAKGRLSQEELNQFAERWVPAIAILTEKLWLTAEQLQNIWAEWIKASVAIPALLQWLQEKYLWALEKQSQALTWRLSTITDSAKNELASFGNDTIWTQNAVLDNLWRIVEDDVPIILGWVADAMNGVTELWETSVWVISDWFYSLTWAVTESWKEQYTVLNIISILLWTLFKLFWVWTNVIKNFWLLWVSVFKDLWNNIKVFWENFYSLFYNLWANAWRAFGNIPFYAKSWLNEFLWLIEKTVNNAIGLLNKIPWVTIWTVSIWKVNAWNFTEFKSLTAWFKELPWFVNTSRQAVVGLEDVLSSSEASFKQLWKDIYDIWKKSAKAFDLNTLDWLWKSINKARQELKGLTIWSDEYIKKQKEIADLEAKFKKAVYSWDWTAPASSWSGWGTSWWSSWSSRAKKQADEQLKINKEKLEAEKKQEERYKKYVEDLEKERNAKSKSNLKILEDWYNDTSKIISGQIDKAKDNIKKLEDSIKNSIDRIKDLKKQLVDLNENQDKDLASRNVEINKRLAEINKEAFWKIEDDSSLQALRDEANKLIQEQKLIEQNVSSEDLQNAQRFDKLSPAEKMLEEYRIKREQLVKDRELEAEKLANLQLDKASEQAVLDKFSSMRDNLEINYETLKKDIEKNITDNLQIELSEREKLLREYEKNAISIANSIRNAQSIWSSKSSSTTTSKVWYVDWWYTGDGGKYDVAWVVHRWEYVVPQSVLRQMPQIIPNLEALRTGGTRNQTYNNQKSISLSWVTVNSQVDLEWFLEKQKWRL